MEPPAPPRPTRIELSECRFGTDRCPDRVLLSRGVPLELVLKPRLETPRVAVLDKDLRPVPAYGSIQHEDSATRVKVEPKDLSPGGKYTIEITANGLEPLELEAAAGSGWARPKAKPARKKR
jgi:hypothetical protein